MPFDKGIFQPVQPAGLSSLYIHKVLQSRPNQNICTKSTTTLPHAGQELITLSEHLSFSLVSSGVRVTRSLVFCVMLCRSLFVILSFFSVGHCIVCTSRGTLILKILENQII